LIVVWLIDGRGVYHEETMVRKIVKEEEGGTEELRD
jgi:hypothetical protein